MVICNIITLHSLEAQISNLRGDARAEAKQLIAACDGCLSQGRWALLTFMRHCPVARSRALDAACPVKELLKFYVDGYLVAQKAVEPFYVMNEANIRWNAHHIFEDGQNLMGWLDDWKTA